MIWLSTCICRASFCTTTLECELAIPLGKELPTSPFLPISGQDLASALFSINSESRKKKATRGNERRISRGSHAKLVGYPLFFPFFSFFTVVPLDEEARQRRQRGMRTRTNGNNKKKKRSIKENKYHKWREEEKEKGKNTTVRNTGKTDGGILISTPNP